MSDHVSLNLDGLHGRSRADIGLSRYKRKALSLRVVPASFHKKVRSSSPEQVICITGRRDLLTRHHRLCHLPEEYRHQQTAPFISSTNVTQEDYLTRLADREPSERSNEDVLISEGALVPQALQDHTASLESTLQASTNQIPDTQDMSQAIATDFFDHYDWSTIFLDECFADDLDPLPFPAAVHSSSHQRSLISINAPLSSTSVTQSPMAESDDISRFGSRLPSLEPELHHGAGDNRPDHSSPWTPNNPKRAPLEISAECRQIVLTKLADFAQVVPPHFQLPSRHALNRFLALYITGFNEHNPVLHLPTTSLESVAVELFLSIASVGARYAHEKDICLDLLSVAQAIASERIKQWERCRRLRNTRKTDNGPITERLDAEDVTDWLHIQVMQALVLMTGDVVFGKSPGADSRDSAYYRAMLGTMIREMTTNIRIGQVNESWGEWVKAETVKRVVLVAFTLFNLHTMLLDIGPSLWWSEVTLELPCSEETWNATSSELWRQTRSHGLPEVPVQDAIRDLFQGTQPHRPLFSSLGGYFLIHAILQTMWMQRQMIPIQTNPEEARSLDLEQTERALRHWRQGWERNKESSMNPVNPSGPIAFTSTALLRLAYVRLSTSARIIPSLSTWDHGLLATKFLQAPKVTRSERATRAALHCAHALSIPIKIGLKFVAHTQSFYWACQHALSSLECAVFLSKWLETVTDREVRPTLSSQEAPVLEYVIQIVHEAGVSTQKEELLSDNRRLSRIIIELWGKVFPEAGVWEIIDLVAKVFKACIADIKTTG